VTTIEFTDDEVVTMALGWRFPAPIREKFEKALDAIERGQVDCQCEACQ
jgi:hypothetical protein